MVQFQLKRIKMIMEPAPHNTWESEGVLNPASARGPDRRLYLFPRLVAKWFRNIERAPALSNRYPTIKRLVFKIASLGEIIPFSAFNLPLELAT